MSAPVPPGEPPPLSLLWPVGTRGHRGASGIVGDSADLGVEVVARAIAGGGRHREEQEERERFALELLSELCRDPAVIEYRQEVVADLLELDSLRGGLAVALPQLMALAEVRHQPGETTSLHDVPKRVAELELFVDAASSLLAVLQQTPPRARALRVLAEHLDAVTGSSEFRALAVELPGLRKALDQAGSVTLGINLSADLTPESATILAVSSRRVDGRRALLGRLLGDDAGQRGVTPLRTGLSIAHQGQGMNGLVRDLVALLNAVAEPVADALARYTRISSRPLAGLAAEVAFLLGAVALIRRLRDAGMPVCRPEIAPTGDRTTVLRQAYSVDLALRAPRAGETGPGGGVVTNPVAFGEMARVWILTGPNRGGKTTYARAVGLAHVLFQAGLHVPASAARLSPVDAIYCHFPARERAEIGSGKLDEEARMLVGIFERAAPTSLILLNEVLTGTTAVEAVELASELVRGLRLLGARAVYVTHLHELATRVAELNASGPGVAVGSLVAEAVPVDGVAGAHRRTFRVHPGPPAGSSHASEIAEQHGLSYRQLAERLRDRGVLGEDTATVQQ